MNVSLTPELEKLISKKVESGMYHSASEVVREALRLLQEHDQARRMRIDHLRKEIARGIEQVKHKRISLLDIDEVKRKGRRRLAG